LAEMGIDAEEVLAQSQQAQQAPQPQAEPIGAATLPPPEPQPIGGATQPPPQPQGIEIAPGVFTMLPVQLLEKLPPEIMQALMSGEITDEQVVRWVEQQMMQQGPQMAGPGGGMGAVGPPPGMVPPGAEGVA
jgi:hypothetical protein